MVSIPILKPPHIFFTLVLRHQHHKPPHSPIPHPKFSTTITTQSPPPPPRQSLDSKFAETIKRIRKLIKKKESTSVFDTKAPRLYHIFTKEPESLHSTFIDNSKYEDEGEEEERIVVLYKKENKSGVVDNDSHLGFKRMEEVTQDLKYLVEVLCTDGYLKRSGMFRPFDELSLRHFQSVYSRGWVRMAAQRFGDANPVMVKYLSENDLKTIARFGCSSDAHKTTLIAKAVRSYLGIDEVPVCRSCKLRKSCKTKDQELTDRAKYLELGDVMQMLTSYAFGLVHQKLTVPDKVKVSTHKLLNQVVQCIKLKYSYQDQRLIKKVYRQGRHRWRKIRLIPRIQSERKRHYWQSRKTYADLKKNKTGHVNGKTKSTGH